MNPVTICGKIRKIVKWGAAMVYFSYTLFVLAVISFFAGIVSLIDGNVILGISLIGAFFAVMTYGIIIRLLSEIRDNMNGVWHILSRTEDKNDPLEEEDGEE